MQTKLSPDRELLLLSVAQGKLRVKTFEDLLLLLNIHPVDVFPLLDSKIKTHIRYAYDSGNKLFDRQVHRASPVTKRPNCRNKWRVEHKGAYGYFPTEEMANDFVDFMNQKTSQRQRKFLSSGVEKIWNSDAASRVIIASDTFGFKIIECITGKQFARYVPSRGLASSMTRELNKPLTRFYQKGDCVIDGSTEQVFAEMLSVEEACTLAGKLNRLW